MIEEIIKILDKRYSRYKELLAHQQGTAEEISQLMPDCSKCTAEDWAWKHAYKSENIEEVING